MGQDCLLISWRVRIIVFYLESSIDCGVIALKWIAEVWSLTGCVRASQHSQLNGMGKKEIFHLEDEGWNNVFCSCHCWHYSLVPSSGGWALGCVEIPGWLWGGPLLLLLTGHPPSLHPCEEITLLWDILWSVSLACLECKKVFKSWRLAQTSQCWTTKQKSHRIIFCFLSLLL